MQYIIIGLLGYALLRLIRNIREADKEARREAESQRRAEEAAQMRAEFRRQQTESKRIVAEQIRQAKELAKHEEQLAKHEKRIADLEFKAKEADKNIAFLNQRIVKLEGVRDYYKKLESEAPVGSKDQAKYTSKIISIENQLHATGERRNKARHTKEMAERELSA